MLVLVHDIPGRMRLFSAGAKGDPAHATQLAARARALPGVVSASASPLTGSLVLRYGAASRRGELLLALGAEVPDRPRPGVDEVWIWARPFIEALAEWLAERLLQVTIAAII